MDTRTLHEELDARGMSHVVAELELAALHPEIRNEALETPAAPAPAAEPAAPALAPAPAPAAPVPGGYGHYLDAPTPAAPVEPAAPAAPAAEPVPDWARPLVDTVGDFSSFMELVNSELEAERVAAAAPAAPAPGLAPETPAFNMYDPDSVKAYVDSVAAAQAGDLLKEQFAPYQPILDAIAAREGETLARAHLDVLAKGDGGQFQGLGEFDRDHALLLANSHMANGVAPQSAFLAAAKMTQEFEKRIRGAGAAQNEADLARAAAAPAVPAGPAAPGAEVTKIDPRDPDRYQRLADNWLAERRAAARPSELLG